MAPDDLAPVVSALTRLVFCLGPRSATHAGTLGSTGLAAGRCCRCFSESLNGGFALPGVRLELLVELGVVALDVKRQVRRIGLALDHRMPVVTARVQAIALRSHAWDRNRSGRILRLGHEPRQFI